MEYILWIKDEYQPVYTKVECGDPEAARRELESAIRKGQEPLLTVRVDCWLSIKIGEPGDIKPKHEGKKAKEPDFKWKKEGKSETDPDTPVEDSNTGD